MQCSIILILYFPCRRRWNSFQTGQERLDRGAEIVSQCGRDFQAEVRAGQAAEGGRQREIQTVPGTVHHGKLYGQGEKQNGLINTK